MLPILTSRGGLVEAVRAGSGQKRSAEFAQQRKDIYDEIARARKCLRAVLVSSQAVTPDALARQKQAQEQRKAAEEDLACDVDADDMRASKDMSADIAAGVAPIKPVQNSSPAARALHLLQQKLPDPTSERLPQVGSSARTARTCDASALAYLTWQSTLRCLSWHNK